MRSTFHGLETARRGLFSQQTALQTTGHNIANANTEGFTRQRVNFVAAEAIEVPGISHSTAPGQLGTGVKFSDIDRLRESFLDGQYRNQNKQYGEWNVRKDTLDKIESIINEPSESGLRSVVDGFWQSLQDLANRPDGLTERSVVMEKTVTMTNAFNSVANRITDLKKDLNDSISAKVTDLNTITSQIAKLNDQILHIEALGDKANDLRDQRDLLTDKLSKLVNIDVTNTSKGYTIKIGNTQLVAANQSTPLDANALPADINSGEIYGYIYSRDQITNSFQGQLDQMVNGLVNGEFQLTLPAGTVLPDNTTVTLPDNTTLTFTGAARTLGSDLTVKVKGFNGLHQLGYTMQDPLQAGGAFFTTKDGSSNFTAANITLNPSVKSDVRNIATSTRTYMVGTTEKVVKGDNQLALWAGQLSHTLIDFSTASGTGNSAINGQGTFGDYIRSMIGKIGVQSQEATRQAQNQQILVDQVDSQRQSVSGVSIDEEMANMIKYQHAYDASARMITTIDQMLDKIINGMGVVGR